MSYVIAMPDMLAAAAADVAGIGSSLSEANGAAAASTTRVVAAGGDEVSAATASLFSSHGKVFQGLPNLEEHPAAAQGKSREPKMQVHSYADVLRHHIGALGGIRTHTGWVLSPLSRRLDLQR